MDIKKPKSTKIVVLTAALMFVSANAYAQFDGVLEKIRNSADQISANNPTYYLKSARAVEPNICLYPNGDPTGVIGPLLFRNSFVATPSCKEMRACSEVTPPPAEPKPADCEVEIPNSASWSRDEKRLIMRSDGTAQLEFKSDGLVQYRSCTPIETPVLTCTSGNIGLFRAEVEYEDPSGNASKRNWDRYQNLAGRRTETLTRPSWMKTDDSRKVGNQKTILVKFTGSSEVPVPAHAITAMVSQRYGDQQATIRFVEENSEIKHYATLKNSSDVSQEWEIRTEITRRPTPPVSRVSFLPASFTVSIEDKYLPDLLQLPGGDSMQTKYLITVFTANGRRDETQIFQTEAENSKRTALAGFTMDHDALMAMKGKSKKLRIHVRALRTGNPWVDGAVSTEYIYETEKEVKFPKK